MFENTTTIYKESENWKCFRFSNKFRWESNCIMLRNFCDYQFLSSLMVPESNKYEQYESTVVHTTKFQIKKRKNFLRRMLVRVIQFQRRSTTHRSTTRYSRSHALIILSLRLSFTTEVGSMPTTNENNLYFSFTLLRNRTKNNSCHPFCLLTNFRVTRRYFFKFVTSITDQRSEYDI